MKKNKLYTANKWNRPAFMPEPNIFAGGGWTGLAQADKKANPWNYADDVDTTQQYMQSKNAFDISKADNPFSKGNLQGGLKSMASTPIGGALISGAAGAIGGLANSAISGGLESGAGSAISSIGSTVGSAVGYVNPVLGAAIGVGSQVLGGVTNALFGEKVDQAKLKAANESMSSLRSFNGNVGSFDDIKGPEATASVAGTYKGGLFNRSAKRKQRALEEAMVDARQYAGRAITNNVSNLADDQINNALANFSAFGGPLDMGGGALDYGLAMDYLTMKKQQNEAKNRVPGISPMPAINTFGHGGCFNPFALGGDVQMHGADFTNGLISINAGSSHEQNPNEGVQLGVDPEGVPNLVEEGETVFDDYVYSNRILADAQTKEKFGLPRKKDITFADISKKLEKESSERPNDPISISGLKAQMHQLADEQERQKQEMDAQRAKAAFEVLSPEEQVAVMEGAAQQEAMAEQVAMQQQAQLSQSPSDQVNQEYNLGQEPQMFATGGGIVKGEDGLIDYDKSLIDLPEVVVTGKKRKPKTFDYAATPEAMQVLTALADIDKGKKQEEVMDALAEELKERKLDRQMYMRNRIHYYAKGGKMKENVYKLLNLDTDEKFKAWAKKHKLELQPYYYNDEQDYNWNALMNMQEFRDALAGDNKALKDALNKGYDFGAYVADNDGTKRYTWSDDFWGNINEYSKQKGNTEGKYKIDTSYKGNVKELEDSDKYKAFTNYILNGATDAERMKYFQWIDANTGRSNKYIKDGKLADNWRDMYQSARTDGLYGIQHYIPEMTELQRGSQAQNLLWNEETQSWDPIVGDVNPAYKSAGNFTWQDPQNNNTLNYYTDPTAVAEEPADAAKPEEVNNPAGNNNLAPKHRAEWLRYAGLFGPAVGLGMMAAGIGRPDIAQLDAAVAGAGDVNTADWKPLGNYLTYRPLDIWFEQNRLNANARATERGILNSGVNQGSKMAGLLAAGYNDQIASGNLFRQAQEYNDNLRKQVAEFNRGTDQFNSEQYGATSRFNADAYNNARRANAQLRLQAAAQKMDADAGWYNSLYGNIAGLFKGIGDIGTENFRMNRIGEMAARGDFGTVTDETYGFEPYLTRSNRKSKKNR